MCMSACSHCWKGFNMQEILENLGIIFVVTAQDKQRLVKTYHIT